MGRHGVQGGGGYLTEIPQGGNHRVLANSYVVVSREDVTEY